MSPVEQLNIIASTIPDDVTLVAVSKTHPSEVIRTVYDAGQRIFGENRPQEMCGKHGELPQDIRWHMIGHLQTNKVKYIAPFVELIHSVDSDRLLAAIDREAAKNNRVIDVLMEVHVAVEETKSGWEPDELREYAAGKDWQEYKNVRIRGLMTIASLTDDNSRIRAEFSAARDLFLKLKESRFGREFDTLSMGMTHDYPIAIECGATMVRIGSKIFGDRDYTNTNK